MKNLNIVTSSIDGATTFGPPVSVLVYRVVDPEKSRVIEIVHQRGKAFVTVMKRTNGLIFNAQDTENSFQGTLTYSDESLSAWSYDINVSKPQQGKLSGNLPENGGKIDLKNGSLSIRKL